MPDLIPFPKMARLLREVVITEKIDGCSHYGSKVNTDTGYMAIGSIVNQKLDCNVLSYNFEKKQFEYCKVTNWFKKPASYKDFITIKLKGRTRWITPEDDNFGFYKWAHQNKDELMKLGPGMHWGELVGSRIQKGYGLKNGERRFYLLNTSRGTNNPDTPKCCRVVPILYKGIFDTVEAQKCIDNLFLHGSVAFPGFMNPEGIVIYHIAGNVGFKKTIKNDEIPKSFVTEEQNV